MPDNPIVKKLQMKPNQRIAIINPPEGYQKQLGSIAKNTGSPERANNPFDFVHIFTGSAKELEEQISKAQRIVNPDSIFWISYPKLSSDQPSNLNREKCWKIMQKFGYRAVSQISIDDRWSALRFKPKSSVVNKKVETPSIDMVKRMVTIPKNLKIKFLKNKKAEEFFNTLSFTHRKEYVVWIETAKKEETRAARTGKTITMLLKGIKNP
jgi:hypothetical protein